MLNEWNKLIKEVQNDCEQLMRLILEMVKQNQDVEDRRYIHYLLTDSSNEIVEQIDSEWNKMMFRLAKGVSKEELEQFKFVARKIGTNMEEILRE